MRKADPLVWPEVGILTDFRNMLLDDEARRELCRKLCQGIARIGDLPEFAFRAEGRGASTNYTADANRDRVLDGEALRPFRLDPDMGGDLGYAEHGDDGATHDRELHRAAQLVYEYEEGGEERLPMSADLFHRLLRMSEGYQLADISTDDTFARLSIFLQRIAREGDRDIMAWNPVRDESMFGISIGHAGDSESEASGKQIVEIRTVGQAEIVP